jgi:gas vesicle protein
MPGNNFQHPSSFFQPFFIILKMEMIYLIIGCMVGGILGAIILYFALKSSMVSRSSYDELNALYKKQI